MANVNINDERITMVERADRIRSGLFRLVAAAGQLQSHLGERASLYSAHRMGNVDGDVLETLLSLGGRRELWVYLSGTAVEHVEVRVGHLLIEAERARPATPAELAEERERVERGRGLLGGAGAA